MLPIGPYSQYQYYSLPPQSRPFETFHDEANHCNNTCKGTSYIEDDFNDITTDQNFLSYALPPGANSAADLDALAKVTTSFSPPFQYFNHKLYQHYNARKWDFKETVPLLVSESSSSLLVEPTAAAPPPTQSYKTKEIRAIVSIDQANAPVHPWLKTEDSSAQTQQGMRILIVSEAEPSFAFSLLCTEELFATIKEEHNLRVSLAAFTAKIIDLLYTTISDRHSSKETESKYEARLTADQNQGTFRIVETNAFRSLAHICLTLQRLQCCQLRPHLSGEIVLRQKYGRFIETQIRSLLLKHKDLNHSHEKTLADLSFLQESSTQQLRDLKTASIVESERVQQAYQGQVNDLQERLAELRDVHTATLNEKQLREREVEELLKYKFDYTNVKKEMENQRNELEAKTLENSELSRKISQLVALQRDNESLAEEQRDMRAKMQKLEGCEAVISELQEKEREASSQLEATKKKYKDALLRLKSSEKLVKELQTQFEEARMEITDMQSTFEERNEAAKKTEREYKRLFDHATALESEYRKVSQANVELNKRLTYSLVRLAKRENPDHFRGRDIPASAKETFPAVEEMLFPESAGPLLPSSELNQSMAMNLDVENAVGMRGRPLHAVNAFTVANSRRYRTRLPSTEDPLSDEEEDYATFSQNNN